MSHDRSLWDSCATMKRPPDVQSDIARTPAAPVVWEDPEGFDPPAWRSGIARTIHAMLRVLYPLWQKMRSKTLCAVPGPHKCTARGPM